MLIKLAPGRLLVFRMSLFSVLFDLPEIILFFLSFYLYHFFEVIVVPVTGPEEFSFTFD
jgi:hypothetical protein